jgi:hypothetical protein
MLSGGMVLASHDKLLADICEIATDVLTETLHCVLDDWMEALEWVSHHNGDHHP